MVISAPTVVYLMNWTFFGSRTNCSLGVRRLVRNVGEGLQALRQALPWCHLHIYKVSNFKHLLSITFILHSSENKQSASCTCLTPKSFFSAMSWWTMWSLSSIAFGSQSLLWTGGFPSWERNIFNRAAILSFPPRSDLHKDVIKGSEILEVLHQTPEVLVFV